MQKKYTVKRNYLTAYFFMCTIQRSCIWGACMEKIIERNILYDFYGELLTEHQRKIYEDSAYGDLSLSEIADTYDISRQGVHDLLKRCDKQLISYEEKLHLIERFVKVKELTQSIKSAAASDSISDEKIRELTDEILELL